MNKLRVISGVIDRGEFFYDRKNIYLNNDNKISLQEEVASFTELSSGNIEIVLKTVLFLLLKIILIFLVY